MTHSFFLNITLYIIDFYMKRYHQFILSTLLLFLLGIIKTAAFSFDNNQATSSFTLQDDDMQFPFPEIPISLQTPNERKEYLLLHYWDKFDFTNMTLIGNRHITEQGFVNFISLMEDAPINETLNQKAIDNFCGKITIQPETYHQFLSMIEDYLFTPQSPLYNEEMYAYYLQAIDNNKQMLSIAEHQHIDFMQALLKRNAPGQKAENSTYYTINEKKKKLSNTRVKGSHLILFFYDPECTLCRETLMQMKAYSQLSEAINSGTLSVLAIYTENNEQVWNHIKNQLPTNWLIGSDHGFIREKALYDLKSIPSLYLLDNKRRVVVKNGSWEEINQVITGVR